MLVIGEKVNVINQKIGAAMRERDKDPIQEMAHWFAEMQMAQASAERVMSLVEAVPEIRDFIRYGDSEGGAEKSPSKLE